MPNILKIFSHFLSLFFLFLASLLIFLGGLHHQEIIGFESRFYLFAKEMAQTGVHFFPTTYQKPYPDYPATSTLFIHLAQLFFGKLNKQIAVLPTACMASLTIMFVYLIGALHQKRYGLYAVFLLLMTIAFLQNARTLSLDMYPTFITASCFYLIYSADKEKKPQRLYWVYPLLIFGAFTRGPIGFIIPASVIVSYYLFPYNGKIRFKKWFYVSLILFLLFVITTFLLFFAAYYTGGISFTKQVLEMQITGRLSHTHLPFYFYFLGSIKNGFISIPIVILVLMGVLKNKSQVLKNQALLLKLIAWMGIILIGMSIPGGKKMRYILPIMPAAALVAAYPLANFSKHIFFQQLRKALLKIFFYFPLLFFILTWSSYFYINFFSLHYFLIMSIILLALQILNFFCKEVFMMGVATVSFIFIYLTLFEPYQLYIERSKQFIERVELKRFEEKAKLAFYHQEPDGMPIKYLIYLRSNEKPFFIKKPHDLIKVIDKTFFVTEKIYFQALQSFFSQQFVVVAQGKIGHIPVVVFKQAQYF